MEKLKVISIEPRKYLFLKYCAGMPRMNFQLRVCHPDILDTVITEFDELMYDGIHALFGNRPLSLDDLFRIHLPITKSGFGISLGKYIATPAHLGSIFDSLELQCQILGIEDKKPFLPKDTHCYYVATMLLFQLLIESLLLTCHLNLITNIN